MIYFNNNRYCLDWILTADWMKFQIALSNIRKEFCDNMKSCLEYLWQFSLISTACTELSDNFKYRLSSVAAFSSAWIEFSHNFRIIPGTICHEFSHFSADQCWIYCYFHEIHHWIHHWISIKILLLSILIMEFGCTEKVFMSVLTYKL